MLLFWGSGNADWLKVSVQSLDKFRSVGPLGRRVEIPRKAKEGKADFRRRHPAAWGLKMMTEGRPIRVPALAIAERVSVRCAANVEMNDSSACLSNTTPLRKKRKILYD